MKENYEFGPSFAIQNPCIGQKIYQKLKSLLPMPIHNQHFLDYIYY
jgi:hypothetical protein